MTDTIHFLPVCQIPSLDAFRATRPQFAAVLELCGGALVSLLWTPCAFALMVRETERGEPALASVVPLIEQLLACEARRGGPRHAHWLKCAVGALACALMEANGFEKTRRRRPTGRGIGVGAVFRRRGGGAAERALAG